MTTARRYQTVSIKPCRLDHMLPMTTSHPHDIVVSEGHGRSERAPTRRVRRRGLTTLRSQSNIPATTVSYRQRDPDDWRLSVVGFADA